MGPPERVIEQLKAVEENYPGLERIEVGHPMGTPQRVILEQLEWFAKEVMPSFKGRVETAVTRLINVPVGACRPEPADLR